MAYSIFDAPVDDIVAQLYLAYLGRAPDVAGFNYWRGQYAEVLEQAHGDTAAAFGALAGRLQDAAEANGEFAPGDGTAAEIITYVYEHILGRTPDAGGLTYWAAQYSNNVPLHDIVAQLIDAARAQETTRDAQYLANRTEVAIAYVEVAPTYDPDGTKAATILNDVNETVASVDQALAELQRTTGQNFRLTVGQDDIVGTAGDDVFTANVVQNLLGQQVNSLGSGDTIDGGAGIDTLNAKITSGVFASLVGHGVKAPVINAPSMPIQPETKNVELINLQAVIANISSNGNNDQVYLNAKNMVGINEISSLYSDASLTIQNLTSKANEAYGSGRALTDMTIGMKYTGNSDTRWDESDFSVYFDQDFIVPQTSGKLSVALDLMNEDAYDYALRNPGLNVGPLDAVYVSKMAFTLNGQTFDLAPIIQQQTGENAASTGEIIGNYAELLAAVRNAIVALKNQNPNNAELQTLQANLGDTFTSDISPVNGQLRVGTSIVLSVDNAAQDNTLVVRPSDLTINRVDAVTTIPNNNRYESAEVFTPEVDSTVAINVALEKVGRAGDGGQLVIGSMFKDSTNTWSDTYAGKGIQEFLVTVYGDAAKPSSLAGLHSTGNNLRVVKVASETRADNSYAALDIGNTNSLGPWLGTDGRLVSGLLNNAKALKDVQDFDASNFKGDLTLYAALTKEVAAKYLNLQDGAPAGAAADNVNFTYLGGSGDDYINLVIDAANLSDAGTTTREDFTLNINGGAGDDEIVVTLRTTNAAGTSDNGWANGVTSGTTNLLPWYVNSKINANLSVDAGDGDDVVRTFASGDWNINLGTGDDTAYLVQTGSKAIWVFNTADQLSATSAARYIGDLRSSTTDTVFGLAGSKLSVTLSRPDNNTGGVGEAFTSLVVELPTTGTNRAVTQKEINQAIKAAINTDPVLSKLLVAEDGPANVLVVRSLIDGQQVAGDLDINLVTPSSAAEVAAYNQFYGVSLNAAGIETAVLQAWNNAGLDDDYNPQLAASSPLGTGALSGTRSEYVASSRVEGGLGDDVLVLSTGVINHDTVVYSGLNNGFDTIVNFQDGAAHITPGDRAVSELGVTSHIPVLSSDMGYTLSGGGVVGDLTIFLTNTGSAHNELTAAEIAQQIAAAINADGAPGGWGTVWGATANGAVVQLLAVGSGVKAAIVATSEGSAPNVNYTPVTPGSADVPGGNVETDADILDFTSYNAESVFVVNETWAGGAAAPTIDAYSNAAVVKGTLQSPTAWEAGDVVIRLVQQWGATAAAGQEDGVYEIQKLTLSQAGSLTNATVEVIGTADFGRELSLHADNVLI